MTPDGFFDHIAALRGRPLQVACDTEFEGTLTLTIQFAIRVGGRIVVQVYHSPAIPTPNANFEAVHVRRIAERIQLPIEFRPVKPIKPSLSPGEVLADLLDLHPDASGDLDVRRAGFIAPYNIPSIQLMLIAHHWPADFFRAFGSGYFSALLFPPTSSPSPVRLGSTKTMSFRRGRAGNHSFHAAMLGYLRCGPIVYSLDTRTFDTSLPFGKGSLDSHAHTFLGLQKSTAISKEEKARMRQTFIVRTSDAYEYAALDAVLALRVAECMEEADRRIYSDLEFTCEETPILRPTQGSRLVETIRRSIAKTCAAGSTQLAAAGRRPRPGVVAGVSFGKLRDLMRKGAGEAVTLEGRSHFGLQNAESHGGLLFSRSSCKFFHDAPGKMRDVDLSGCYNSIIGTIKLYLGRPIVLEPGNRRMTLRDAVARLQEYAAGRDAWVVKVSGRFTQWPNTLIPSTQNALTGENYLNVRRRRRAQASRRLIVDEHRRLTEEVGHSVLYTDVVESGFVSWATWQVIKALPEEIRREYEELAVDTILFYHRDLVARSGPEFDALIQRFSSEELPWGSELNWAGLTARTDDRFDDDYVALEFDVGSLARRFAGFRAAAQDRFGPDSGAAFGWKQHGNTMYGVMASRYLETNNVVAANVITSTGRALAFAMQMSLNGIQVITDGCTYRSDQIPDGTLADCLAASPEYPIRRIEEGVPFVDPASIPQDDAGFTAWYRRRVQAFFATSDPEFADLLTIHSLQHKRSGGRERASFDGLLCDGSGNYVKLLKEDGVWTSVDFKARSYTKEAKEQLFPWMLATYMNDRFEAPPAFLEMKSLVSYKDAVQLSWTALSQLEAARSAVEIAVDPPKVWLPLGLDARQILAFKAIKPSAFLFRTPHQRARVCKYLEKFSDRFGCGLELISLRRGRAGEPRGSIVQVAERLYRYIRSNRAALGGDFNLTHLNDELRNVLERHAKPLAERKAELQQNLVEAIDVRRLSDFAWYTGLIVGKCHLERTSTIVPT